MAASVNKLRISSPVFPSLWAFFYRHYISISTGRGPSGLPSLISSLFSLYYLYLQDYDVKVKRYPMALSLVKLHKQPKGLGERPVLGRWAFVQLDETVFP